MAGRRDKASSWAWAGAGLVCALGLLIQSAFHFGLRINRTPSLPFGLYQATTEGPAAALIAFCAPPLSERETFHSRGYTPAGDCPDGGLPLLKPVVARQGDTVKVKVDGLEVNGRLLPNSQPRRTDGQGRVLASYPAGTYTVPSGTLWVVSTYNPDSLDSRYFGPLPVSRVREHVRPLWTAEPL